MIMCRKTRNSVAPINMYTFSGPSMKKRRFLMSSETMDELRKLEEKESEKMVLSKEDFSKLPEEE